MTTGHVKVSGYTWVHQRSADDLKAAIAKQPVAVRIDASTLMFRTYESGVITSRACMHDDLSLRDPLNHAVLAVGYGVEDGQEYYLVKNSVGTNWGENGYVKIGISQDNGGYGICAI